MEKYYFAKQDLEKYPTNDLLTMARHYGINSTENRNDLCWLLSLRIFGYSLRGEMNSYVPWEELWEELSETEEELSETEDEPSETEDEPSETEEEVPETWEERLSLEDQCDLHENEVSECKVKLGRKGHHCSKSKASKDLIAKYHRFGDRWWRERCNKRMSVEQLSEAIHELNTAYNLRCEHANKFCKGAINEGHMAALLKIQRKLAECLRLKCKDKNILPKIGDIEEYISKMGPETAGRRVERREASLKEAEAKAIRRQRHEKLTQKAAERRARAQAERPEDKAIRIQRHVKMMQEAAERKEREAEERQKRHNTLLREAAERKVRAKAERQQKHEALLRQAAERKAAKKQ